MPVLSLVDRLRAAGCGETGEPVAFHTRNIKNQRNPRCDNMARTAIVACSLNSDVS